MKTTLIYAAFAREWPKITGPAAQGEYEGFAAFT
jgi:hypothetical protein